MNGWGYQFGGIKRKEDPVTDEEVTRLMNDVTLSAPKKLRLSEVCPHANGSSAILTSATWPVPTTPTNLLTSDRRPTLAATSCPSTEPSQDAAMGQTSSALLENLPRRNGSTESETRHPEPVAGESQKALVLYKAIGPPAVAPALASKGQQQSPGFGSIVVSKELLGMLANVPITSAQGPTFMKALDLSGMADTADTAPQKMPRSSSCSSLPQLGDNPLPSYQNEGIVDAMEEEMEEEQSYGDTAPLAVIPWQPPPAALLGVMEPSFPQNGAPISGTSGNAMWGYVVPHSAVPMASNQGTAVASSTTIYSSPSQISQPPRSANGLPLLAGQPAPNQVPQLHANNYLWR